MQTEDEVTVLDVYRLESQEISVDFSDGTSMTLTVQELFALRDARSKVTQPKDQPLSQR